MATNKSKLSPQRDVPAIATSGNTGQLPDNMIGKMWAKSDDIYLACDTAVSQLDSGFFFIGQLNDGRIYFKADKPVTDDLFEIPDGNAAVIIEQIEHFWKSEAKFKSKGLVWKRGFLLWGAPGVGKTSTIHLISSRIIAHGGVVFYGNDPSIIASGLKLFRKIEPVRPILLILEDIDAIVQHNEEPLLSLLDGEVQIDNIVIIATTNYPQKLDKRVVDRPRRIDVVQKITSPTLEARKFFLMKKASELADEPAPTVDVTSKKQYEQNEQELLGQITAKEAEIEELKSKSEGDKLAEVKNAAKIKMLTDSVNGMRAQLSAIQTSHTEDAQDEMSMLDYIATKTEGLSLAHLVEIVLAYQVFEQPVDKAIERMIRMHSTSLSATSGDAANW